MRNREYGSRTFSIKRIFIPSFITASTSYLVKIKSARIKEVALSEFCDRVARQRIFRSIVSSRYFKSLCFDCSKCSHRQILVSPKLPGTLSFERAQRKLKKDRLKARASTRYAFSLHIFELRHEASSGSSALCLSTEDRTKSGGGLQTSLVISFAWQLVKLV